MLVFPERGLVFLAVPKAASTSVEAALVPFADTSLPPEKFQKHIPAQAFYHRWSNFRAGEPRPDAFAVLRDPVDRMRSWYTYRQRPELDGSPNSTKGISFDAFIAEYLSDDPKPFAKFGNQYRFCTDAEGRHLVRYLFCYAQLHHLEAFLSERFGQPFALPRLNVSGATQHRLEPGLKAQLEVARRAEFDLFDKVARAGWKTFDTPP